MKLYVLGVIASVLGGVCFIAAIVFLRLQPELDDLWPAMFGLYLVGNVAPAVGTAIAVLIVARPLGPLAVALVLLAPVVCLLTTHAALTLPEWSTIDWLILCEGPCPAPPGQNEFIAIWIISCFVFLGLSLAWTRGARTVVLLVLAATPLANVAVFLATPSTPPSTTAPRSPATAETPV